MDTLNAAETAANIEAKARALATDAGWRPDGNYRPGRFEGEPYYVAYYHDAVMNGDGEPVYDGDIRLGDVLDVDEPERIAFKLRADTVSVLVTHSEMGFIGVVELTAAEVAKLGEEG